MFKCPCCKGKGGYTEPILDDGSGPYYPCEFCKDSCKVSIFKWLQWIWYVEIIDRIYNK